MTLRLSVKEFKEQFGKKKNKYNAARCEEDGISFDSEAERRFYQQLKFLQKMGVVKYFLMQVPFYLPGKTKYYVDFVVFYTDGAVRYVDVKGKETAMFKLKKRQVESLYPVTIEVVKA